MPHQCKTVFRLFMYYKVLFLCAFCRILLWQFMLHSFHVALFPYCTISVLHFLLGNLFMVHFFSSFTLSYKHVILHVAIFGNILAIMAIFCFAFFSRCTLRILQFFLVALCSCCTTSRGVARSPHEYLR